MLTKIYSFILKYNISYTSLYTTVYMFGAAAGNVGNEKI